MTQQHPVDEDAQRTARRASIRNLLDRAGRGILIASTEGELLRQQVEAEIRLSDQATKQCEDLRAESLRRGKENLAKAERIRELEKQLEAYQGADAYRQAETERDGAYRERARLVALIAGGLAEQAVIAAAPDVDEPGWQILYVTLHGRQCSWHISPRDADLFEHLEHVPAVDPRAQWDGHTTEAKYEHIDYLARALGTPGPFKEH
ncbi:hypothetical protein ACFCYB_00290 [Streptomyces sp. NPDC056309]|uniref:hypothetical protein n=1 Tax=Streptomyces sp. NPDC056309 TaxID=3345781 RepID=UPI0035D56E1A